MPQMPPSYDEDSLYARARRGRAEEGAGGEVSRVGNDELRLADGRLHRSRHDAVRVGVDHDAVEVVHACEAARLRRVELAGVHAARLTARCSRSDLWALGNQA